MEDKLAVIAGIFLLLFASIIFVSYGTMSIASTDIGAQQTINGTTYQPAYNASTNTVIVGMSFLKYLPLLLGLCALIVILIYMANRVK